MQEKQHVFLHVSSLSVKMPVLKNVPTVGVNLFVNELQYTLLKICINIIYPKVFYPSILCIVEVYLDLSGPVAWQYQQLNFHRMDLRPK